MLLFYTTNLNYFCLTLKRYYSFALKYDHEAQSNIFYNFLKPFKLGQSYLILYLYLISQLHHTEKYNVF